MPRALYEPRRYTLPTPTAIELPNYKDVRVTPAVSPLAPLGHETQCWPLA